MTKWIGIYRNGSLEIKEVPSGYMPPYGSIVSPIVEANNMDEAFRKIREAMNIPEKQFLAE